MKIDWLGDAIGTLDDHVAFVAHHHTDAARRLRIRIFERVEQLQSMPHLGRPGRTGGLRELSVPRTPYVIVYRVRDKAIEILRVLHGAQKWPEHFDD